MSRRVGLTCPHCKKFILSNDIRPGDSVPQIGIITGVCPHCKNNYTRLPEHLREVDTDLEPPEEPPTHN
jgi:hypothetical protein